MARKPIPLDCQPRWATPRTASRATLGPRLAEVAQWLGTPLMPWQQYVADVALELDEHGHPAYREVGVMVPRQQGKSVLLLAAMVHRAIGWGPAQNVLYAAQNGSAARVKLEKAFAPALRRSRFGPMIKVRMSIGHEAIMWLNGSWMGITSGTTTAGHGETLDLGVIDEAWAQTDNRLEQAYKPAMVTRPEAQMWWVSTAGLRESSYLEQKQSVGRALVETGVTRGTAFFEWSADPAADPASPRTWRSCMPAWGHTITQAVIASDQQTMKPTEFRRAYLNLAENVGMDDWAVIGEPAWSAQLDRGSKAMDPLSFAIDVTPERSFAAIAVAGARPENAGIHLELVEHRRGTGWVVGRMVELYERWRPAAVVVDSAGPAASLITSLEAAGVPVVPTTTRSVTAACGQFYDAVAQGTVWHMGQAPLSSALAGAQRRPLGDAWAWTRKGSSVDISPLVAVTLALWGHSEGQAVAYELRDSVW